MPLAKPLYGVRLHLSPRHSPQPLRSSTVNSSIRSTARAQQRLAQGLSFTDVPFDGGAPAWRSIFKYHSEFQHLSSFRRKVRVHKWHLDSTSRFESVLEGWLRGTYFRLPDTASEFGRRVRACVDSAGGLDRLINLALFIRAHKRAEYLPPRLNPNFVAPSVVQQAIASGRAAPIDRADIWQSDRRRSLTSTRKWQAESRRRFVSETARHPSPVPIVYTRDDALAYASSLGLRHHADVLTVLMEAQRRLPGWRPRSVLDFGSGCGSAVWAAQNVYGKSEYKHLFVHPTASPVIDTRPPDGCIDLITCIEPALAFRDLLSKVLEGMPVAQRKFLPAAQHIQGKEMGLPPASIGVPASVAINAGFEDADDALRGHDLVLCCHSLGELTSARARLAAAQELWRRTHGMLVIVEWGTRKGFENVMQVRDMLLKERDALGADHPDAPRIVAPCPHHQTCPLVGSTTHCHFRTLATRDHDTKHVFRMDTGAALGLRVDPSFERDRAPISYLVVVRNSVHTPEVTSVLPDELRKAFVGNLEQRDLKHREAVTLRPYGTLDGRHVESRVVFDMLSHEAAIARDSSTFARVLKNTKPGKKAHTVDVSLCTPLGDALTLTLKRRDYLDSPLRGWRLAHQIGYARALFPMREIAPPAWDSARSIRRVAKARQAQERFDRPERPDEDPNVDAPYE